MPVIAVAAGAAAVAGGISVAAAATTVVGTALGVAAAVGGALSVVGVVTKNKDLSRAGMVLGAVGGVGSLAAGFLGDAGLASMFGVQTADSVATSASDAAPLSAVLPGSVQDAGAEAGLLTSTAAPQASSIVSAAGEFNPTIVTGEGAIRGAVDQATGNAASIVNTAAPTGLDTVAKTSGSMMNSAPSTAAKWLANGGVSPTAAAAPSFSPMIPGASVAAKAAATPLAAVAPPSSGTFSNILGFVDDHPMVAFGALQAGGSLLSGMTDPATPAQIDALEANAAANRASAAISQQQQQNAAQPIPVASRSPVTGAPQGMINSQPQPYQPGATA